MPRPRKKPIGQRAAEQFAKRFGNDVLNTQVYLGYRTIPDREEVLHVQDIPQQLTLPKNDGIVDLQTVARNQLAVSQFMAQLLPFTYGGAIFDDTKKVDEDVKTPFTNVVNRREYIKDAKRIRVNTMKIDDPTDKEREALDWLSKYSDYRDREKWLKESPFSVFGPSLSLKLFDNILDNSKTLSDIFRPTYDSAYDSAHRAEKEDWQKLKETHPEYVDTVGDMILRHNPVRHLAHTVSQPVYWIYDTISNSFKTPEQRPEGYYDRELPESSLSDSKEALLNEYTRLGASLQDITNENGEVISEGLFEGDPMVRSRINEIEYRLRNKYGIKLDKNGPWGDIKIDRGGEYVLDNNNNIVTQNEAASQKHSDFWNALTDPAQYNANKYFDSLPMAQLLKILANANSDSLKAMNQLSKQELLNTIAKGDYNYFSDAKNSFLSKMNQVLAESFLGDINVELERLQNLGAIEEYYRFLSILEHPSWYPQQYVDSARDFVKNRESLVKKYISWWNGLQSFAPGKNNIVSLVSKLWFSKDFGGRELGDTAGAAGLHEMMIDTSKSTSEILKDIDNYKQLSQKYINDRREGYNINAKQAEDYKKNISSLFLLKELSASSDIFDLNNWLYRMPGQSGSSASSWTKTGISEAISFIAGLATSESGGWGYLAAKAATLPAAFSAGEDEASANVAQNVGQRFKHNLESVGLWDEFKDKMHNQYGIKKSDEELMLNAYMAGDRIAGHNISEQYGDALHGVARSKTQDVAATTMDSFVELAVAASMVRGLPKAISKITSADGMFTKTIAPANPLLASITKPADKLLKEAGFNQWFQEAIPNRLFSSKVGKLIANLTKSVNPANYLSLKTYSNLKYVGGAVGRTFKTKLAAGYSEAIEEGKQQAIQEAFINGNYDWQTAPLGIFTPNIIVEDINTGLDIANIALGIPLGIERFEDAEKIENMKGGFMGGGSHIAISNVGMSIYNYNTQRKLNRDLAKYVDLLKQGLRGEIEAAKGIAKLSKYGTLNIGDAIDRVASYYNNKGDKLSAEAVEQKRDWLLKVALYSRNPQIKEAAKKHGIDVNSDDYNTYVALISSYQIRNDESLEDHIRIKQESNRSIQSKIDEIFGKMDELGIYRPDPVNANIIRSIIDNLLASLSGTFANYEQEGNLSDEEQDTQVGTNGFTEQDKQRFLELYTEALELSALSEMHDEQTFAQYINNNKVVSEQGYRPSWNTAAEDQKWVKRQIFDTTNRIFGKKKKKSKGKTMVSYKQQLLDARKVAESFGDIKDLLAKKRAELYSLYQTLYYSQMLSDLMNYDEIAQEEEEFQDLARQTMEEIGARVNEDGEIEYNSSINRIKRGVYTKRKKDKHTAKDVIKQFNDALEQDRLLEESIEQEWLDRRWQRIKDLATISWQSFEQGILQHIDSVNNQEQQEVNQAAQEAVELTVELEPVETQLMPEPSSVLNQGSLQAPQTQLIPEDSKEIQELTTQQDQSYGELVEQDDVIEDDNNEATTEQHAVPEENQDQYDAQSSESQQINDVEESEALLTQNDTDLLPRSQEEVESFELIVQGFIDHINYTIDNLYSTIQALGNQVMLNDHSNDAAVLKTELQNAVNRLHTILEFSKQSLGFADELTKIPDNILLLIDSLISFGLSSKPAVDYVGLLDTISPIIRKYLTSVSNWKNLTTIYKDLMEGPDASYCVSDKSIKLADVASNPDFILNSKFELLIVDKDGKSFVLMIVHYGGMTFTPMNMHTSGYKVAVNINGKYLEREVGQIFFLALRQLIKSAGKDKAVVAKIVRRTNGKIKDSESDKTLFQAGFMSEDQMFDIEYSGNGLFGILRTIKDSAGNHIAVTANNSVIYTYTDPTTARIGTMVYMLRRGYDEDGRFGPKVPVNIIHTRMTEGDAKLVVDILSGKYTGDLALSMSLEELLDLPFYQDGMNIGMTRRQVLNLILPYSGSHNPLYSPMFVQYDGNNVVFVGEAATDGVVRSGNSLPTKTFDITSEAGRAAMVDFLINNVDVHIHEWVLQSRLHDPKGMFGSIVEFMNKRQIDLFEGGKKQFTLGNSRISFSLDDIRDLGGKSELGVSGLVWYAKRGFITTKFGGFEAPLLNVDMSSGFDVIDRSELQSTEQQSEAVKKSDILPNEENAIINSTTDAKDVESMQIPVQPSERPLAAKRRPRRSVGGVIPRSSLGLGSEFANRKSKRVSNKKINTVSASKNLKRILGDDFTPDWFVDKVIDVTKSGANVLGRCWQDGRIFLSTLAHDGTEFHEAFHRVSELLMTLREHDKLYKAYRRAYKLGDKFEDRDIAEMLADEFAFYFTKDEEFKVNHGHKTLFDKIKYWTDVIGRWNSYKLHRIYREINSGKYAYRKPSIETQNRFKDIFKEKYANVKINGIDLDTLFDTTMYRDAINSLTYLLVSSKAFNYDGSDFKDLEISKDAILNSILYKYIMNDLGYYAENPISDDTKQIIKQLLDNFDAIVPDIVTNLQKYSGNVKLVYDQNSENSATNEDSSSAGSEQTYDRSSYEISPFNRASDKVKFFFSRLLAGTNVRNGDEVQSRALLNSIGLPFFFDAKVIYNKALVHLCECRDINEMIAKAKQLSERDGEDGFMFQLLYKRLERLKSSVYEDVVKDGKPTGQKRVNWDAQSFLSQIYTSLRSTRNNFVTHRIRVDDANVAEHRIMLSDADFTSYLFKQDWSDIFAHSSSYLTLDESGRYMMAGNKSPRIFLYVRDALISTDNSNGKQLGLLYAFSEEGIEAATANNRYSTLTPYTIRTRDYDGNIVESDPINVTNPEDLEKCKDYFISILNNLGIIFDKNNLNYYLLLNYGGLDYIAFRDMLNSKDFQQFAYNISGLVRIDLDSNGNRVPSLAIDSVGRVFRGNKYISLDKFFNNDIFVDSLAKAKYTQEYNESALQVLGVGRKRLYRVSENNTITDQIYDINRYAAGEIDLLTITDHMNFIYNLYNDNDANSLSNSVFGSIILKALKNKTLTKICAYVYGGTKSDAFGDYGDDYANITDQEDALAKIKMLAEGYMCSPTMSDKKTWMFFSGIDMPGLRYDRLRDIAIGVPSAGFFSKQALILMLEYAKCEYANAMHTLNNPVDDLRKVENYHEAKACGHKIIPGARMYGLSGIFKQDGLFVSFNRVLDDSGNFVSERKNLQIAYKEFFSLSEEELLDILSRTLLKQAEETIQYCLDIGIIQKRDNSEFLTFGKLDNNDLKAIYNALISNKELLNNLNIDEGNILLNQRYILEDMAVRLYLSDISIKQNISMHEFDRIFAGHPAFYKTRYDINGKLVDDTEDYQKRLGGLVSTGANNDSSYPGSRIEYTAAQIRDYKVPSKHLDDFKQRIELSEFRQALKDYLSEDKDVIEDFQENIDDMSVDQIKSHLPEDIVSIVDEIVSAKSNAFDSVNVTDGAAYMSADMCEDLLKSVGLFDNKVRRAFAILKNPNKSNSIYEQVEAYRTITTTVIGAQKYTAFGFRNQDGVLIPYYDKMALFPIFESIAFGRTKEIFDQMNKQGIDVLFMSSAVKVGGQSANTIDLSKLADESLFTEGEQLVTYKQRFDRLRKQFNTDPKPSETMSVGTQALKIVYSSMRDNEEYNINMSDGSMQTMSRSLAVNYCMLCINKLSDIGENEIREKYFDGSVFNLKKFVKELQNDLRKRGASQTLIDQMQMISGDVDPSTGQMVFEDGRTGDKDVVALPLFANSSISYILSIIVSEINSKVVDVNTAGLPFYQRSSWGTEYNGSTVIEDSGKTRQIYGGKELQIVNEDGSMDCVLSIDFFEHSGMLPESYFKDANGKRLSFNEIREKLIKDKIIGELAEANIFSYRIPTQAVSSVFAFRCVDVIPVIRDTIIVPKEFTAVTGSDFDIDKLFLNCIEYGYGEGGALKSDFSGEDSRREYANKLLNAWISILKDSASKGDTVEKLRSFGDMRGSIDSDTQLVKDVLKDIESSERAEEELPYGHYSLVKSLKSKAAFIMAKAGIGPFALNNVNHVLTSIYGISFKPRRDRYGKSLNLLTELNLLRLDKFRDKDGNKIFSWLSGFINAHVDVAKDPYITRLNVNKYTWNIINLLIRTGYGKDSLYFVNIPAIRNMANSVNNMSKRLNVKNTSKSELECRSIIDLFKSLNLSKYYNEHNGDSVENIVINYFLDKYGLNKSQLIRLAAAIMRDHSDVMRNLTKGSTFEKKYFDASEISLDLNSNEVLLLLVFAFKDLSNLAQLLGDLVLSSKIDTKKQGKNIIEQIVYFDKYQKVFNSNTAFNDLALSRMQHSSYIDHKTVNSTNLLKEICKNISIDAQEEFQNVLHKIANLCGILSLYVDAANKIRNAMLGKIKAGYFFGRNGYCEREGIDPRSLFVGSNSIYSTLLKIKQLIATDPKYMDMRDASGNIDNYLLKILTSSYKFDSNSNLVDGNYTDRVILYWDGAKFIKPATLSGTDNFDDVEFQMAWEELLNDVQHPELLTFAKRLIVYAFMTSADNGGGKDIFRYVPLSWRTNPDNSGYGNSYAAYMESAASEWQDAAYSSGGLWYDDIFLNNWNDNILVPRLKISNIINSISSNSDEAPAILSMRYGIEDVPPLYVKNVVNKKCVLYRLADGSGRMISPYKRSDAIYILVDARGFDFGSRGRIYEYNTDYLQLSTIDQIGNLLIGGEKFEKDVKSILGNKYSISDKDMYTIIQDLSNLSDLISLLIDAINKRLKDRNISKDKEFELKTLKQSLLKDFESISDKFGTLLLVLHNSNTLSEDLSERISAERDAAMYVLDNNNDMNDSDSQFIVDNNDYEEFNNSTLPDGTYNPNKNTSELNMFEDDSEFPSDEMNYCKSD